MNDETREQLSAYLDGALPEAERLELEGRLAASAELRGALEDLRAVSRAVKDLPQQPLPPGFLARLQARSAAGESPRREWVLLPPQARPVVAAMSFGVVALVIWNKVTVPPEPEVLHPPATAKVYDAANAPVAQLNVAGARAGESDAKALEIAGPATERAKPGDIVAELQDKDSAPVASAGTAPAPKRAAGFGGAAALRGGSARAPGQPLDAASADAGAAALSGAPTGAPAAAPAVVHERLAMSEEERSARNEEMIVQLEKQKKTMGMKVLPRGAGDEDAYDFLGRPRAAAAPVVRAPAPTLLGSRKLQAAGAAAEPETPAVGPGRLAPDAALVFTDARSLSSSWVLLGFPGDPPAADFANGRVVVIKPSATRILSVTPGADAVSVVFRSLSPDEASDPARDRVAPLPALPKTVLIYDASPR